MSKYDVLWFGPIMGRLNIQCDIAVGSAQKSFQEFRTNPDDSKKQIGLFRTLRHASFVCGSSSTPCTEEITRLYNIAEEASSILENGLKKTKALRGIQQQVKDRRKAYHRIAAA